MNMWAADNSYYRRSPGGRPTKPPFSEVWLLVGAIAFGLLLWLDLPSQHVILEFVLNSLLVGVAGCLVVATGYWLWKSPRKTSRVIGKIVFYLALVNVPVLLVILLRVSGIWIPQQ